MMVRGERVPLVDVRSRGEYDDCHAQGAVSLPIEELDADRVRRQAKDGAGTVRPLYLICASGIRADRAARKLRDEGLTNISVVDGGTEAWRASNLPVRRRARFLSLERQTQIALGALILMMLAKGALLHPLFFTLVGLLGVGLIFSGLTGRCGLAALLARMPWNQAHGSASSA